MTGDSYEIKRNEDGTYAAMASGRIVKNGIPMKEAAEKVEQVRAERCGDDG